MPRPLTFYDSPAWRALRVATLRRDHYRCVICNISVVHKGQARVDHIKLVKTHPHLKLDPDNVRTLCTVCDAQSHRERGPGRYTLGGRIERFVPKTRQSMVKGAGLDGWPYHRLGK